MKLYLITKFVKYYLNIQFLYNNTSFLTFIIDTYLSFGNVSPIRQLTFIFHLIFVAFKVMIRSNMEAFQALWQFPIQVLSVTGLNRLSFDYRDSLIGILISIWLFIWTAIHHICYYDFVLFRFGLFLLFFIIIAISAFYGFLSNHCFCIIIIILRILLLFAWAIIILTLISIVLISQIIYRWRCHRSKRLLLL